MSELIQDNTDRSRFELHVDGQVVFASYRRQGEVLAIYHVEAPPQLRGTGAAGRLMRGVAEAAHVRKGGRLPPTVATPQHGCAATKSTATSWPEPLLGIHSRAATPSRD